MSKCDNCGSTKGSEEYEGTQRCVVCRDAMPNTQEDEQFDLGDGIGLEISVLMNAVYVDAQNGHPRSVTESAARQALRYIRQYTAKARLNELEKLPFTDLESGCMSCVATGIVEERIEQLEEGM